MHRLSTFILSVLVSLATARPSGAGQTAATIDTIAPAVASYGESVTITGIGFGGRNVQILVGGLPAAVLGATGSRVTFRVPTGVPVGPTMVTAVNPGGHRDSVPFAISRLFTLALDESRAMTALVGRDGGVLRTESAGVQYILTIPRDALLKDEVIILTPIVTIAGFPLGGGLLGGAHFAPEGLQLFRPATLTIQHPPGSLPAGVLGVGFAGNGDNIHLVPHFEDRSSVTIPVTHFSGVAEGTGTIADAHAVVCENESPECVYSNETARLSRQLKESFCAGLCDTDDETADFSRAFQSALTRLFRTWFDDGVLNFLESADEGDAALQAGVREFFSWQGQLNTFDCTLDGQTDLCSHVLAEKVQTGIELLGEAFLAAVQRANDACDEQRFLDLVAGVELLGLHGEGGLPPTREGLDNLFACRVSVEVAPQTATREPGGTLQYTARNSRGIPVDVTWAATGGSITPTGLGTATYTAPLTPGIYAITATSVVDPSRSEMATVTVTSSGPPPPTPPPPPPIGANCPLAESPCRYRGVLSPTGQVVEAWIFVEFTNPDFGSLLSSCGPEYYQVFRAKGSMTDGQFSWPQFNVANYCGDGNVVGTMTATTLEFTVGFFDFRGTRVLP